MRDAWDTVRLSETITHAHRNSPFYEPLWRAHGIGPEDLGGLHDLVRFPVVRKADFADDPARLISRTDAPDSIRDTSGTTGLRLPVYTNFEEDRALSEMRSARAAGHPSARLVLRILPPPQRLNPVPFQDPRRTTRTLQMHVQPRYDPAVWYDATDMAIGVLMQEYFVANVSTHVEVIHATPPPLFDYLTQQILARGVSPAAFGVKEIALTGGPLSPAVRAFIEESWGARVVTSYSCTEIRGELLECTDDPAVVHAGLSVLAEVVDRHTAQPVADGDIGEVALTGFFPFQKVMPLVRYCPGDMAQFHAGPCSCGSTRPGLRVLGRTTHYVDLPGEIGAGAGFGTTAVLDAIGTIPQIPRFPYPRFHTAMRTATGDRPVLKVEIEATNPDAYDAASIEDRIRAALLAGNPTLAGAVERRAMDLEVHLCIKNSLSQFFKIYPGR